MTENDALGAFAALSNATRLDVIRHLVRAGTEGLAAGEIARRVDASPSQTSFHLNALTEAGLITSARDARRIVYQARFERIGELVDFLLEDCCGGDPAVRACCGLGRSC